MKIKITPSGVILGLGKAVGSMCEIRNGEPKMAPDKKPLVVEMGDF
jgi:hypothetical protein